MDKLFPWILISALLKKFQYKFSRQNNPIGFILPRKANLRFKEQILPIKAPCVHMYVCIYVYDINTVELALVRSAVALSLMVSLQNNHYEFNTNHINHHISLLSHTLYIESLQSFCGISWNTNKSDKQNPLQISYKCLYIKLRTFQQVHSVDHSEL